jgi:hypothetical protein
LIQTCFEAFFNGDTSQGTACEDMHIVKQLDLPIGKLAPTKQKLDSQQIRAHAASQSETRLPGNKATLANQKPHSQPIKTQVVSQ